MHLVDQKKIRNEIQLIKSDCGEVCETSLKAEREIHKGGVIKYYTYLTKMNNYYHRYYLYIFVMYVLFRKT